MPRTVAIRRCREHVATEREQEQLQRRVLVKQMGLPKGKGVFARRDLPEGVLVGVLPGRVVPDKEHVRMAAQGVVSGRFCMETRDTAGRVYVVEPEDDYCMLAASRFESSVGHFVNEPAPGERLNAAWVHNPEYDPERMDCYTIKAVPKGKEILVHYGSMYNRKYRQPAEAPATITAAQAYSSCKPRLYTSNR